MLGDVLTRRIGELKNSTTSKKDSAHSFWIILKKIAIQEIVEINEAVDSDIIIPIYYDILKKNKNKFPSYFSEKLKSNKQERFRVINRNIFSSNAFHTDGIANDSQITARKELNANRKGYKIIFERRK